jgi:hypothetical protein
MGSTFRAVDIYFFSKIGILIFSFFFLIYTFVSVAQAQEVTVDQSPTPDQEIEKIKTIVRAIVQIVAPGKLAGSIISGDYGNVLGTSTDSSSAQNKKSPEMLWRRL